MMSNSLFLVTIFSIKTKSVTSFQSRSCAGGGVIIYACDGLEGNPRRDLKSDELEETCLELKQRRCTSFCLSCLYRPPNTSAAFLEDLT